MRRSLRLPATLTDSASSAAASFAVGVLALRQLDSTGVALYSLLFAGGIAAMIVPQQMSYLPRRILINKSTNIIRPNYRSDALGALPSSTAAMLITVAAGLPLATQFDPASLVCATLAASLWVAFSSFQDHVRTSLHVTRQHVSAAIVSVSHLSICVMAFTGVHVFTPDADAVFIPFIILATSNAVSAAVGVLLHRKVAEQAAASRISLSVSFGTAGSGFLLQTANYATNLSVAVILGTTTLASLEAVRITAQPILVAGAALAAMYVPDAIRMQHAGKRSEANRHVLKMGGLLAGFGVLFLALMPIFAPIVSAVTTREVSPALSGLLALAFSMQAVIAPLNQLNIARGLYGFAFFSTFLSSTVALVLLLSTLFTLGLFAVPLSIAAGSALRAIFLTFTPRAPGAPPT